MIRYNYRFSGKKISESEVFSEASATELKVIIALMEKGGKATDEELIELTGVSKARLSSTLALFEEAGVIEECEETPFGNNVKYEFPERVYEGELEEQTAAQVASTLRRTKVSSLIEELETMMGKTMTHKEAATITGLVTQFELSEEYIAILAAHICEEREFTVSTLATTAKNLCKKEILTVEELEIYFSESERRKREFSEYRKLFGMNNRSFTNKETEYLQRWSREYGFDMPIVSLAYDITSINTNSRSLPYMQTLLGDWHEAGCKTVEECEKRYEAVRLQRDMEAKEKKAVKPKAKKAEAKPKLGTFDPEEAFRLALQRSYAVSESDDK